MSSKRTFAALAGALLTVSAFVVMPLVAEDETSLVATAEPAVTISDQREEDYNERIIATTTTVPPTTTTAPPATTTTHTHEAPEPAQEQQEQQAPPAPSGSGNGDPNDDASWYRLYECESAGLGWGVNTGNGYYGGLQFSLGSWQGVGGTGYPHEHSAATQIAMGKRLWAQGGWAHWPGCTRSFGWR